MRRRRLRRRAHQQILGLLVHGEQRNLAQVLGADQQHDDAIDSEGHAAMRRGTVLERTVETAEPLFDVGLAQADILESLTISSGDWLRIEPEAISKPLQTMRTGTP